MALIERLGRKSWFARQVRPASSVSHSPPDAVPASRRLGERGSNASERTRPPTFDGPSACHCEGCNPAAFSRPLAPAAAATIARRCSCARRIFAAVGGPFSSDSTCRLYSAEIGVSRSRRSARSRSSAFSSSSSFASCARSIG
jgi:hypothetical protein